MTPDRLDEALTEMRSSIQKQVAEGFRSEEEIASDISEMIADEYKDILTTKDSLFHAKRITREAFENHAKLQASWPSETDCDRLDRHSPLSRTLELSRGRTSLAARIAVLPKFGTRSRMQELLAGQFAATPFIICKTPKERLKD